MKKRAISFVLALVMCLGFAMPALGIDLSASSLINAMPSFNILPTATFQIPDINEGRTVTLTNVVDIFGYQINDSITPDGIQLVYRYSFFITLNGTFTSNRDFFGEQFIFYQDFVPGGTPIAIGAATDDRFPMSSPWKWAGSPVDVPGFGGAYVPDNLTLFSFFFLDFATMEDLNQFMGWFSTDFSLGLVFGPLTELQAAGTDGPGQLPAPVIVGYGQQGGQDGHGTQQPASLDFSITIGAGRPGLVGRIREVTVEAHSTRNLDGKFLVVQVAAQGPRRMPTVSAIRLQNPRLEVVTISYSDPDSVIDIVLVDDATHFLDPRTVIHASADTR